MMLEEIFPDSNIVLMLMYHLKKLISRIGLDFKSIDGCPKGCALFDQEHTKD